jgi:hypothetical protein
MRYHSRKIGNDEGEIRKIIRFLSSNKNNKLEVEVAEVDSNILYSDLKRYIDKFGNNIGIVKETKMYHYDLGSMRYTKVILFKGNTSKQELISRAIEMQLKNHSDKVVSMDEYKLRKVSTVAV